MQKTNTLVGVKELREHLDVYIAQINKGVCFTVVKRSKPVFNMTPITPDTNEEWEEVIDFTKIKKGGVKIEDILSRL